MPARRLGACVVLAIGLVLAVSPCGEAAPDPLALIDDLGSGDRAVVERAVVAIEHAPSSLQLVDAMFRAAQACEDTLEDPARALALYERILHDLPDTRRAGSAARKIAALRERVGSSSEHAREAAELAQLIAEADRLPPAEIERRAEQLVTSAWAGAPDAALWLAEWLRRTGRLAAAQARYAEVVTRWPGSPSATLALRGGAGNALDAHDWDLAERLANQLPEVEDADRVVREDLVRLARRGRQIDRWYVIAWLVVIAALAALVGSLVEAAGRGGWRAPRWKPPIEVVFLTPVAAVLVGVALTAHQLIAPAVTILSIGGIALAWLSGATLDTLRARTRPVRRRALVHVAICALAVAALAYVAVVRDNLFEMVVETVKFGPEP